MLRYPIRIFFAAAALLPGIARSAEPVLAFVTCPIVRDTRTVPCWLAEHDGELYYLGIQVDSQSEFRPPSLGHKVLVEGAPTDKDRICGGIPLEPVRVSPLLQEQAPECLTILPAEDRYDLTFDPPRPPGPGHRPLVFIPPQEPPKPPFEAKTFDLPFDFDSTVDSRHSRWFRNIAAYARQIDAGTIDIIGLRGVTPLTDGGSLVEQENIGVRRATQIAELLQGGGLIRPRYVIDWVKETDPEVFAPRGVKVVVSP